MQIKKPLLASSFDPDQANFPYAATPKIDGIRFLMVDGQAVSRSFKPIRNEYVQRILSETLPDGIDGELTCGTNFQDSTSGIMTIKGEPDFHVWIFDYVERGPETILPYNKRMLQLEEMEALGDFVALKGLYTVLQPVVVNDIEGVQELMEWWTKEGYEGVMLRDPFGTYKFGRSSVKEGIILKVKEFMDAEAEVVGFKEKMSNQNEAALNELGYTERKGGRDGMVPAGTLGALRLMLNGQEFNCGSGFNDELRKEIWENRGSYVGKLAKFKFMSHGVKDLPRHPIFLGFRDIDDMS